MSTTRNYSHGSPELGASAYAEVARSIEPAAERSRFWSLSGGISARSTALAIGVAHAPERVFVVRELSGETLQNDPHAAAHQFGLLRHLHERGVRVPEPILYDESRAILPTAFLVMRHIDAAPVYQPARPELFTAQLAAALAELHAQPNPQPHPQLAAALDYTREFCVPRALEHVAVSLDRSRGPAHGILHDAFRRLKAAWPPPQRNPERLLHGDYWSGNVLWRGDELAAIIDWEDARVGDPLLDLAIARLDLVWLLGADAMRSFTAQYAARTALDWTQLPYWDLYAALRPGSALQHWSSVWAKVDRPDITEQTMQAGREWFAQQALSAL
jgi:aminoglycoside phosphotransferase (APT) family kinase protein